MRKYVATIAVSLSGWTCLTAGAAPIYSVKDLGKLTDLDQRALSAPHAVNDRGNVVAVNAVGGTYRAMLYSSTSWHDLATLGGPESYASGLNDSGQVVGHALTAAGEKHAFLWIPGATDGVAGNPQMKDLGALAGGESEAFDVNNSGQVSGYVMSGKQARAFVYSNGKITKLESPLNGFPNTFAYSINDSGHVAGTAYDASYSTMRAFSYDGSATIALEAMGDASSSALAINETGAISGYFTTEKKFDHAFRSAGGKVTDLGTLGGDFSYGLAINKANAVVGGSFVDRGNSVYHAFLQENNLMVDLNACLDASGSGWVLTEAYGINDSGQIVGLGSYKNDSRIFLLQPAAAAKEIKAAMRLRGADVVIDFNTSAGLQYKVQACGDILASWTDLVTGITGTGSAVTITNQGGANLPKRFFRVSTAGF